MKKEEILKVLIKANIDLPEPPAPKEKKAKAITPKV